MIALVLAGGHGTRLQPRFGDLPKALAPLAGKPFLARQLEWLAAHGLTEVTLLVGVGAEQVESALGNGSEHGVSLRYSREPEPLGTGGALAHWRDQRLGSDGAAALRGPFLVVNGDTLPELDPWDLERARWERGRSGALALFRAADAAAAGRVDLDAEDRVIRFVEKDAGHRGACWVSGGCYAFDARLWGAVPPPPCSLERDVLPALAARGELQGLRLDGSFFDIGTPEGWARTEARFAS